jgi:hypothetical protein
MDDKYIYVKQKGSGSPAKCSLAEENNLNRFRDPDKHTYPPGTFESKHDIIDDGEINTSQCLLVILQNNAYLFLCMVMDALPLKILMYKGGNKYEKNKLAIIGC